MVEVSRQERFDKLAERMRARTNEKFVGVQSRTLLLGQAAIRFTVFIPREGQPAGYNPSILFQDLVKDEAHNGPYMAPTSEIMLRRNKLEGDEVELELAELEAKLDLFEKFLDLDDEISG